MSDTQASKTPLSAESGAFNLNDVFLDASEPLTGESLEQVRHNYFIAASMRESDDVSVGGVNINTSGRKNSAAVDKAKSKQAVDDAVMMAMMHDSLATIEAGMVEKYGEDFAENLAAEVLDEETYTRLMQIEDPDERRRQIAIEVNQGIANGTIDPEVIAENPDFVDWLYARDTEEHKATLEAKNADADSGVRTQVDGQILNGSSGGLDRDDHKKAHSGNEAEFNNNLFG